MRLASRSAARRAKGPDVAVEGGRLRDEGADAALLRAAAGGRRSGRRHGGDATGQQATAEPLAALAAAVAVAATAGPFDLVRGASGAAEAELEQQRAREPAQVVRALRRQVSADLPNMEGDEREYVMRGDECERERRDTSGGEGGASSRWKAASVAVRMRRFMRGDECRR